MPITKENGISGENRICTLEPYKILTIEPIGGGGKHKFFIQIIEFFKKIFKINKNGK